MGRSTIDRLIVNSPYEESVRHWKYDRKTRLFNFADGRRPATSLRRRIRGLSTILACSSKFRS